MRKVELSPTRDCEAGYGPDSAPCEVKLHLAQPGRDLASDPSTCLFQRAIVI